MTAPILTTSAISATMAVTQVPLHLTLSLRTTDDHIRNLLADMRSSNLFDSTKLQEWESAYFSVRSTPIRQDLFAFLITRYIFPTCDEQFENRARELFATFTPAATVGKLIGEHEAAIIKQAAAEKKKAFLRSEAEKNIEGVQTDADAMNQRLSSRFEEEKKTIDALGDDMVAKSEARTALISSLRDQTAAARNSLKATVEEVHTFAQQKELRQREQQALLKECTTALEGI